MPYQETHHSPLTPSVQTEFIMPLLLFHCFWGLTDKLKHKAGMDHCPNDVTVTIRKLSK